MISRHITTSYHSRPVNYGLVIKCRLLLIINKQSLMEHNTLISLLIACGCLCATIAELSSDDRDHLACKA